MRSRTSTTTKRYSANKIPKINSRYKNQLTQDFDFLSNKISLTFIETPGLGNQINNQQTFKDILLYIEQQYDNFLEQESRISRNVKQIMGFLIFNQIHVLMLLFSLFHHKVRLNWSWSF